MKHLYLCLAALLCIISAAAQNIPGKTLNDTIFKEGDIIRFPAVLYDLGKATLRPGSKDSLDHVVRFMNKHPHLVIEVQNHCDTRVSDHLSVKLTEARARSCVEYLVSKGIPKTRLVPKGYNDKKPIVTDAEIAKLETKEEIEAAHQKNRRTVLKVLRTDHPNDAK